MARHSGPLDWARVEALECATLRSQRGIQPNWFHSATLLYSSVRQTRLGSRTFAFSFSDFPFLLQQAAVAHTSWMDFRAATGRM